MKRMLVVCFLLIVTGAGTHAQLPNLKPDTTTNSLEKDKPGFMEMLYPLFRFEVGFNHILEAPSKLDQKALGSRGVNVGMLAHFRLADSVGLRTGLLWGSNNYKFKKDLKFFPRRDTLLIHENDSVNYAKSKLNTNYLEIPLELDFKFGNNTPVNLTLGGKVGMLVSAHTKLKYEDKDGITVKEKLHHKFQLRDFRYGLYGRLGYGSFNFFAYYSLTPMFKEGKGPEGRAVMVGVTTSSPF